MIIRHARAKDAKQVLVLMKKLAEFEGYSDDFKVTKASIIDGINKTFFVLVSEENNLLSGILVYYFLPFTYDLTPWLFIKELYVDKEYRGENIGGNLMKQAENICKDKGGSKMIWSVLKSNLSAQEFYKGHGARHDDNWQMFSKEVV